MIYVILKEILRKEKDGLNHWETQSLVGYVMEEEDVPKALNEFNEANKDKDNVRYTCESIEELYPECL